MKRIFLLGMVLLMTVACGGRTFSGGGSPVPRPRKTVVWVAGDVGEDLAVRLQRAGVSLIVVRSGSIDIRGGTPLVTGAVIPRISGEIPVSAAFRMESGSVPLTEAGAEALWRGLASLVGETTAEIILDLPRLSPGISEFVRRLEQVSGLPVVPILTVEQIRSDIGLDLARTVRTVIVPLYGPGGVGLRGVGEGAGEAVGKRLESLVGTGVGVRAGIVLTPRTEPKLPQWGEDLNVICEGGTVEISTTSQLDRAFIFQKATAWSGLQWKIGDRLEVGWMDAVKLNMAMNESAALVLPDIVGWDLVTLPPAGGSLGIDRGALIAYLEGRGPEPSLDLSVQRRGRSIRVTLENEGPFVSAVSGHGNWVEVSLESGYLVADDSGSFDRIELGNRVGDRWKPGVDSGITGVRFIENLIGADERLTTGWIRLPSSRSRVITRWSVILSDGTVLTGMRTD